MIRRLLWSVATLFAVSGTGISLSATEIIAHRGASYDAPENTLASLKLAWEQQADAVELDIYLLEKEQLIVAMHDKTPKRYGGPDRPVEQMTWAELGALDVGSWKDPLWKAETPPLLAQYLQLTPPGKKLYIEIKSGPEIVPFLKRELESSQFPPEQTVIIAFSEEVVAAVRKEMPEILCYWLVSIKDHGMDTTPSAAAIIQTARKLDVPGVDVGGALTEPLIRQIRDAGLECYAWTINDPHQAKNLIDWGMQGITTDRPGWLREQLTKP